MVDMPGKLYELKLQVEQLVQIIDTLKDGVEGIAEVEAIKLEQEAARNGGVLK